MIKNFYDPNAVKATLDTFGGGLPVAIFLQKCKVVPKIGFFDDYEKAAVLLQQYDGTANVFFSLNKISDEKLRRVKLNPDDLAVAQSGDSLTNADISCISWFFVDVDPIRAEGYEKDSASKEERDQTITEAIKVKDWLVEKNAWPDPIMCSSGNGVHLLFKIDMPNTQENTTLIKNAIESISKKFPQVDASVASACRYAKLYGTLAVKGENTLDRPYRRSEILRVPAKVEILSCEKLFKIVEKFLPSIAHSVSLERANKEDLLEKFYKDESPYIEPFTGKQNGQHYVTVYTPNGGIRGTYNLLGDEFCALFQQRYKKETEEIIDKYRMDKYIWDLGNTAILKKETHYVFSRVGMVEDKYFYDLCDGENVVVICPNYWDVLSWDKIKNKNIKMICPQVSRGQVLPEKPVDGKSITDLLFPFFNLDYESKVLLLITILFWMVAPTLPKPILNFYGVPGSGKTTITKFIQEIVDPLNTNPSYLARNVKDIVLTLNSRYMTVYDNLTGISQEISNLFCQVCTGGSFECRELYKNSSINVQSFNNALVLNGLSGSYGQIDLYDRMVRFKLSPHHSPKSLENLEKEFETALPGILWHIFDIISRLHTILKDVHIEHPSRMSDYERYGAAFSKMIFGNENVFLKAYAENRENSKSDFASEDLICSSVLEFLTKYWRTKLDEDVVYFAPSKFYVAVTKAVAEKGVNTRSKEWPQSTNKFTTRLRERCEEFKDMGLIVETGIKKDGKRYYRFTKFVNTSAKKELTKQNA